MARKPWCSWAAGPYGTLQGLHCCSGPEAGSRPVPGNRESHCPLHGLAHGTQQPLLCGCAWAHCPDHSRLWPGPSPHATSWTLHPPSAHLTRRPWQAPAEPAAAHPQPGALWLPCAALGQPGEAARLPQGEAMPQGSGFPEGPWLCWVEALGSHSWPGGAWSQRPPHSGSMSSVHNRPHSTGAHGRLTRRPHHSRGSCCCQLTSRLLSTVLSGCPKCRTSSKRPSLGSV